MTIMQKIMDFMNKVFVLETGSESRSKME